MEIIVLGTGCAKCKTTYETVKKVIEDNGLDIKLSKQEDLMEIIEYNGMSLPGIVVDGEVKRKGYVPSDSEMRKVVGV